MPASGTGVLGQEFAPSFRIFFFRGITRGSGLPRMVSLVPSTQSRPCETESGVRSRSAHQARLQRKESAASLPEHTLFAPRPVHRLAIRSSSSRGSLRTPDPDAEDAGPDR